MSYPTQQLQPFTLYMTISVPEAPPHTIAHIYDADSSNIGIVHLLHGPEGTSQHVVGSEKFEWGIYWHRELGDGTWYNFRFTPPEMYKGPPGLYQPWIYSQVTVKQSPRLHHHVVGLLRIIRVPDTIGSGITAYLDWMAPLIASKATRDDLWAMSVCLRMRKYVAREKKTEDKGVERFDATLFTIEATQFAYREV
ncbi:hypothetical protein FPANT_8373 [Fusarium pseudoanthophilum]|uniref:Uncharacterized protein n=1 Tax=Fusarium pseudoanthophilum TaxID=48495 RepID=A0A8H5P147_9HYPO|nr:hypothetical protein FPANT_8373 [Fusarium pseudoanthophilum]